MAPGSPITLADVQAAEPVVQAKLDEEFFHVRFEKATPAERRYMAAMADLGAGPYKTGTSPGASAVAVGQARPPCAETSSSRRPNL